MVRYICGRCSEPSYGLNAFKEHVESEHDYQHISAAVNDCKCVDKPRD